MRGGGGADARFASGPSGMTLIELLIAVTIVTLLMAVSIPLIRYSLDSDKVREGSRQLNMILASARTRAIEYGRPCGIWLQRSETNPNAVFEIYHCESPPSYIGDAMDARVTIYDLDPTSGTDGVVDTAAPDLSAPTWPMHCRAGDLIRFGRKGQYLQVTAVDPTPFPPNFPNGWIKFQRIFPETTLPLAGAVTTFEVLGQPRRTNTTPLQLADGVVVDLRHSGVGAQGSQFAFNTGDAEHVVLAFDGTGSLSFVFHGTTPSTVDGPVHLLVGKLDQLEDAESTATNPNPLSLNASNNTLVTYDQNLADPASLWVTVGSRNGTITTSENGWELRPSAAQGWSGTPGPPYFANSLRQAREFAQAADAMGGR